MNSADFIIFADRFDLACPSADWYVDYDANGYINSADFIAFADRFGSSAAEADSGAIVGTTTQTDFYYSSQGQIIQEDSIAPGTGDATLSAQNVWGEAYVNELVLRDSNNLYDGSGNYGVSGSGLNDREYALQDANYDITSLVNANGTVDERFLYDPWGNITTMDKNFDVISNTDDFAYGWQGGRVDSLTGSLTFNATGDGRTTYDPGLHTWLQPDNAGYDDSMNPYQMERGNPVDGLDPTGLGTFDRTFANGGSASTTVSLDARGCPQPISSTSDGYGWGAYQAEIAQLRQAAADGDMTPQEAQFEIQQLQIGRGEMWAQIADVGGNAADQASIVDNFFNPTSVIGGGGGGGESSGLGGFLGGLIGGVITAARIVAGLPFDILSGDLFDPDGKNLAIGPNTNGAVIFVPGINTSDTQAIKDVSKLDQIDGNVYGSAENNEEDFMRSAPVDVDFPRSVIALRIKAVELNRVL